jgi:hypothetical protein
MRRDLEEALRLQRLAIQTSWTESIKMSKRIEVEHDRELLRLLDAISPPDDASYSDLSSELASNFSREPLSFVQSCEARDADYFGNSVNSTITRNIDHVDSFGLDDDSQLEFLKTRLLEGAFPPQQVTKMMDWLFRALRRRRPLGCLMRTP